jgi:hypothetical protein
MSRGRKPKSSIVSESNSIDQSILSESNPIDQSIEQSIQINLTEIEKIFGSVEMLSQKLKVPIENLKFEKEGNEIFIYDYNEGRIKGNQKKLILKGTLQ